MENKIQPISSRVKKTATEYTILDTFDMWKVKSRKNKEEVENFSSKIITTSLENSAF